MVIDPSLEAAKEEYRDLFGGTCPSLPGFKYVFKVPFYPFLQKRM